MSKAGQERQRERAAKRKAEIRRKERRKKLRTYAVIVVVLAMLGGLFAAAAIADAEEGAPLGSHDRVPTVTKPLQMARDHHDVQPARYRSNGSATLLSRMQLRNDLADRGGCCHRDLRD